MRQARGARDGRPERAARLSADRRHSRVRPRSAEACCSAPTARSSTSGRGVTVQALGGTGGLKVGADFLRRFAPGAQVWISDPSWENHRALFEGAGFTVNTYAYYDAATRGLDFPGMIAALERIPAGGDRRAARVLPQPDRRRSRRGAVGPHPRSRARARADAVPRYRLSGLRRRHRRGRQRRAPLRRDARDRCSSSSSFSKSFSLYGERVGALSIVATDKDEATRVLSQVKRVVRAELFEPADARRRDRGDGAGLAGAARAVGSGARDDARPHQAHARGAGRAPARAHCRVAISATCSRSAACSRTRA